MKTRKNIYTYKTSNGELRHRVKLQMPDQSWQDKTFRRKTDAISFLNLKLAEREQGKVFGYTKNQDEKVIVFATTFLKEKELENKQRRTVEAYQSALFTHVLPIIGHLKLSQVQLRHGNIILDNAKKKSLSPKRINYIALIGKMLLKSAVKKGYLLSNPFNNLTRVADYQREIEYWDAYQVNRFLRFNQSHEHYALFLVALNCGLRPCETFGLCWDCISFDKRQISVRRIRDRGVLKERTKTGTSRVVPMNRSVFETLSELSKRKAHPSIVFTNKNGSEIDYMHFAHRTWKKAVESAKLPSIKFKSCRSTFASNFVINGGDLFQLAKILGHSSVKTTEKHYAHLHPDYLGDAANIVNFSAKNDEYFPHSFHGNVHGFKNQINSDN